MKAGPLALIVPALLAAGVSAAAAQRPAPRAPVAAPSHQPPSPPPSHRPPPQFLPQPPANPPPPQSPAALSVPDPLAGFRPGPRDLYQSPDGSDRFQHLARYPSQPIYGSGGYFPGGYYYPFSYYSDSQYYDTPLAEMASNSRYRNVAPRGGLVLQTIPDMAQVFVDGYYVGLAEEFGLHGRAMDISAGTHRVELRAPGYETLAFSVMVAPNDIVRYRGDMQALSTAPLMAVASQQSRQAAAGAPAKSFYVIPNCYAGDKPPSAPLPKGCDVKKLPTRK